VLGNANAACYARYFLLAYRFRQRLGYWPDIACPTHFHEKMLWRKIFDRDPRFTELSDKLKAKAYVSGRHPDVAVPPLLWAGTDVSTLPAEMLAGDVFLKASHGSGLNLRIVGGEPGWDVIAHEAGCWLRRRYGRKHREWGYFGVEPRLFLEPTLKDKNDDVAFDYKVYVSGGRASHVFLAVDRFGRNRRCAVFDRDGRPRPYRTLEYGPALKLEPHAHFADIVRVGEEMGRPFDQVRVDFIATARTFQFVEFTFYSEAGYDSGEDRENPMILLHNRRWDLRQSRFLSRPQPGPAAAYADALKRCLDSEPV